jgi:acyl-coenzyme A thioesterase PaaI-like protein
VVTFKVTPAALNMMGNLHGSAFALMADELSTLAIFAADQTMRTSVTVSLAVNCLVGVPNGATITYAGDGDAIYN